ncbi:MAG: tRNA lysidine(34) synthetase TilS [Betaproteobacteria bacterium]|nr:MAG: tRNA lysidine(34) synthetase TilS [Betaproteobacteria bacterium]
MNIAFRSGGERMALAEKRPHRPLKKLFQDAGLAPWLRERTPLIYCGRRLVFVPGLGAAAEFQARNGEESWQIKWVQART